jgi:hypothetical protein
MATRAEIEAYIRQAAVARGLDPDFAVRVAKGESGLNPSARLNTAKEDSKGIWQLNTKNGLGVEALKRGIDPGDPNQWQQQTDFALDQAKKSWRPWTVARNLMAGRQTPAGATTPRKDGAPGPAETPTRPANVDQGLLAYAPFKLEEVVREKQQEQVHQQAVNQAQEQLAQAAQQPPMSEPTPLSMTPLSAQEPDFAALMLPRLRRGLLADQRYAGGLLDGGS